MANKRKAEEVENKGEELLEVYDVCCICSDPSNLDALSTLTCPHKFHRGCLTRWFQQRRQLHQPLSCPTCRNEYVTRDHFTAICPECKFPNKHKSISVIPFKFRMSLTTDIFKQAWDTPKTAVAPISMIFILKCKSPHPCAYTWEMTPEAIRLMMEVEHAEDFHLDIQDALFEDGFLDKPLDLLTSSVGVQLDILPSF